MKPYRNETEEQTDTHLSKKYNDALFDCIMRCNLTSYMNQSVQHYDNLCAYIAAVDTFFINTYFLFEYTVYETKNGKVSIATLLIERMKEITKKANLMKYNVAYRTKQTFQETANMCRDVHMMIMYGLQRRNMLVRVSEKEPRGMESIKLWDDKVGFNKGAIPYDLPKDTKWK